MFCDCFCSWAASIGPCWSESESCPALSCPYCQPDAVDGHHALQAIPPKSHPHRGPPGHLVTNGFSIWVVRPREHIPSCVVIRRAARHSTTTLVFPYLGVAVPRVPGFAMAARSSMTSLWPVEKKITRTDTRGPATPLPPITPSTASGWSPHPRTMPFPAGEWAGRVRLAPATFCCGGGRIGKYKEGIASTPPTQSGPAEQSSLCQFCSRLCACVCAASLVARGRIVT
jgi:hypothetical protein